MSEPSVPSDQFPSVEELRSMISYDSETGYISWNDGYGSARKKRVGHSLGWKEQDGYKRCRINGERFPVHRIVWFIHYGEWPSQYIDHINGDRADNRISNLRQVSAKQNQWNRKAQKNKYHLPKGVTKKSYGNPYQARITVNGAYKYLGCFKTPEEAAEAYRVASESIQKEYAYHLSAPSNQRYAKPKTRPARPGEVSNV